MTNKMILTVMLLLLVAPVAHARVFVLDTPRQQGNITGDLNVSGDIYSNNSEVCTVSNGLCSTNTSVLGLTNITDIPDGVAITGDINMTHNQFYIGQNAKTDGAYAMAFGYQSNASAIAAVQVGGNLLATNGIGGIFSTGVGYDVLLPYNYCSCVGYTCKCTGDQGTSVGWGASAGEFSASVGMDADASGQEALALGSSATASHNDSVAAGTNVDTTANNQFKIGDGGQKMDVDIDGSSTIRSGSSSTVVETIIGAVSQTANLLEAQASNTTVLAKIDKDGNICADQGELCLQDYGIAGYSEIETPNILVYDASDHTFQGTSFNAAALAYFYAPQIMVWAGTHTLSYAAAQDELRIQNAAADQTFTVMGTTGQTANLQEWSDVSSNIHLAVGADGVLYGDGATNAFLDLDNAAGSKLGYTADDYLTHGGTAITETFNGAISHRTIASGKSINTNDNPSTIPTSLLVQTASTGTRGITVRATAGQTEDLMELTDSSGNQEHEWRSNGDYYIHNNNKIYFTNTTGGTNKALYIQTDAANRAGIQINNAPMYIRAPDNAIYITSSNFEQAMSSVWDMKYAGTTYMRVQTGLTLGNSLIGSYAQAQDGDLQIADQLGIGEALLIGEAIQAKIKTTATDHVGLEVEGMTGQLGNLTEWRNSTSSTNLYVTPQGDDICKADGTCLGTLTLDVPLSFETYDAEPARGAETNYHGGLVILSEAGSLNSTTNITITKGIGKIMVGAYAGADSTGTITITGTSVDRNTGVTTPSDTDTLTLNGLSNDGTYTDTNGNTVHNVTENYLSSKWFVGTVTISTSDVSLTDVDTCHVSFEQFNDQPDIVVNTFDQNLYTTNANAEVDSYLYAVETGGGEANVTPIAELHVGADGETALANKYWRLRKGGINKSLDGTSEGVFVDVHYSNSPSYVEDVTTKVWATQTVSMN